MQPTHAKWEPAPESDASELNVVRRITNGEKHEGEELPDADAQSPSIFAPVKPIYSRNFLIVDTVYENPPYSMLGVPGPDSNKFDIGFNGLTGVSEDILSELPPECRKAFDDALVKEKEWKSQWGTESVDAKRKAPIIDKGLIM